MNLLKAASTVSLWTLLSRIVGLAREQLVAHVFGASATTDAFNIAFRIPNLLRRLFAEGAFSAAFVPILANSRETQGDGPTHALLDAVATVLFWILVLTCVVGVVGAPVIVWLFGAGLEKLDLAVLLTRWMFPYIGFMSLVALSAGILNTWKHFVVPAATPVLMNIAVVSSVLFVAPWLQRHGIEPIHSMSVGVLLGGVLQLGIQVPALLRIGCLPRIGLSPRRLLSAWHHPGVHRLMRQMAPALLGVSVAQISILINSQIASHLGPGAVSWLTYADRLMEFPTALLGVALGVVLMPGLAALRARQDDVGYAGHLDWGLRLAALLALPCSAALMVFALPMVTVLFHHGRFDAEAVGMTSRAVQGYGVGLIGLIGVKVLAPGFYARQDIRTPVRIAIIVLILTQLMNAAFVPWLGHAGLALATSLGAVMNASWLLTGLWQRGAYRPSPGWWAFLVRVVGATALMAAWLAWVAQRVDWIGLQPHWAERAGLLAATLTVAALVYFGTLRALGLNLRQFARQG